MLGSGYGLLGSIPSKKKFSLIIHHCGTNVNRVGHTRDQRGICIVTLLQVMLRFQKRCGTAGGRMNAERYVVGVCIVILFH